MLGWAWPWTLGRTRQRDASASDRDVAIFTRLTDSPLAADALPAPERRAARQRRTPPQRPLRDNPIFVLLAIGLLVAALVALVTLADRSTGLSPALLSEVVLYALVAVDLTMLGALGFVLARNVIKLLVERRRALPFARFRAKLVAAMLGLTLVPAVLVLIVGSELIRNSAEALVRAADRRRARRRPRDRERLLPGHAGADQPPGGAAGASARHRRHRPRRRGDDPGPRHARSRVGAVHASSRCTASCPAPIRWR